VPLGPDLHVPAPDANPITVEKVDRGRRLFHDRRLARDGSIACSTGVAWQPSRSDEPTRSTPPSVPAGYFRDPGNGRGGFKTPTLREVARTAPYMHDGSITSLPEVIDFYDSGGRRNRSWILNCTRSISPPREASAPVISAVAVRDRHAMTTRTQALNGLRRAFPCLAASQFPEWRAFGGHGASARFIRPPASCASQIRDDGPADPIEDRAP